MKPLFSACKEGADSRRFSRSNNNTGDDERDGVGVGDEVSSLDDVNMLLRDVFTLKDL